jgi:lipoprotein-anchoring transpeptidase ErfK/SrfK
MSSTSRSISVGAAILGALFAIQVQAAEFNGNPEVKVFTNGRTQSLAFDSFAESFRGGASVAAGDLNGDGDDEIIVGAGPGGGPNVRVFNGDGSPRSSFMAYDENFRGGVSVASCDVNGDGRFEIVTGPRVGGGPNVRVFNGDGSPRSSFMAYDENFRGGVSIACGDVTGDGASDIVTGSGSNSGNHVRVFNTRGDWLGLDFWPFAPTDRGGVSVAVANVDGSGPDEIIAGISSAGPAWVKIYRALPDRPILAEFLAFPESFRGGVNLSGGDYTDDGQDEVVVAANGGGGPDVRFFDVAGNYQRHLFPYPESFRGGVTVGSGDINGDGRVDLLTGPGPVLSQASDPTGKKILVDLSEQRLYAFDHGQLKLSTLVSTGVARLPTPVGSFAIFRKIANKLYQGPDYYLPNTPWNMNFKPGYYLHAAYWHNNFGHPMSHGCVNLSIPDAKWLYDWAPIGTSVTIQP